MTDLHRFINALKILRSIDLHEMTEAGIVLSDGQWRFFCDAPDRWMMKASDADAERVWAIVQARQPKEAR